MTPPLRCLQHNKICINAVCFWPNNLSRYSKEPGPRLSVVFSLHMMGSLTQTESLCIPFISHDFHHFIVPGLKVKHKEHKHGDHAAGWLAGWLLKVLYPASQTQTKTLHLLSVYRMSCALALVEKERPPAGPRGLGISASTPTAPYRSFLSSASSSMFHHPTPNL